MTDVLVAPYLPLRQREIVGPWELIPRSALVADDVSEPRLLEAIPQLLDAYRPQSSNSAAFGVVIRSSAGKVGEDFDRTTPALLRCSLLAAVLETNPSRLTPEEERTGNEGHESLTSDNVLIRGHSLNDGGWVADQYGLMVTMLVGGMRLGEPGARFEPPGELIIPALPTRFDGIYATAIYDEIAKGTPLSRRITRALDWLGMAWRNTSALEVSTRIVALRAGFEVLFGVGDSTRAIRDALGQLMNPPDAPRVDQTWTEHGKSKGPFALTAIEWWFQSFSMLRNSIMHGDEIPATAWEHGEHHHIWIAEDNLRKAIKEILIRAGHPEDLRDDPAQRLLARRIAQRLSELPDPN
jgi:hypothetical protein